MNIVKQFIYGGKITELLESGTEFLNSGNYYSAINCFSHILEVNKKNEDALFFRANTYLKLKNYFKAQQDLEDLEKINPEYNSKLNYLLAKTYQHLGDKTKAVVYADKYHSINNEDPQSQYFSARSKYLNGELEEALKLTDLLISRNIDDFNLRYLRSLISFSKENFVSAIVDIDKAIELDTLSPFAYNLRGIINISLLNYKEAINDFDYAIRLNPANANYFFNKAKIQLKIGDLIDAMTSANNAIELDPDNKSFFMLKAELELLAENHSSALDSYIKASKLDPTDLNLLERTSGLRTYLCDFDGAVDDLLKILEIEQKAEIYYKVAFLYYKLNREEEALIKLEHAVQLKPEYKEAILQKGILNYWTKNYEESIKMFDSLNQLDPTQEKSKIYKARALVKLGQFKKASEELAQISDEKNESELLLLSSQIDYAKNDFLNAQEKIEKFQQIKGSNNSTKLIKSYLDIRNGETVNVEELDEFDYEGDEKSSTQVINAVLSYEKNHYNTAKFRLSNVPNLSEDKKSYLTPLINYTEEKLAAS